MEGDAQWAHSGDPIVCLESVLGCSGGEGWAYSIRPLLVTVASPNNHHWALALCCVRSFSSVTPLNPPPLAWEAIIISFYK